MQQAATQFIILTHARSGSNLLAFGLREHGQIYVGGEFFNDQAEYRKGDGVAAHGIGYTEGFDGEKFLREGLFEYPMPHHIAAAGFKLFYNHARSPRASTAWEYLARRKDVRIIRLLRENLFASWVSHEVAFRTNVWVVPRVQQPTATLAPFPIAPERCLDFFQETERYIEMTRETFRHHPTCEVSYERELCTDYAQTMSRVFWFLDVEPREVVPQTQSQGRRSLSEQVSNYMDLERRFRGTRYARFFK